MSFTRWIIFASFTGGILALSLQPSGIANATSPSIFLVTNNHEGASQDTLRSNSQTEKQIYSGTAESSGKMQSNKDAQSGGDRMGKNSKTDQSRDQGGGASQGSSETDPSGPLNLSNPGKSEAAKGAGSQ